MRRTAEDYGEMIRSAQPPSQSEVAVLRQALFNATQSMNNHVPATSVLTPANFGATSLPEAVQTLPCKADPSQSILVPAHYTSITEEPASLASMPIPHNFSIDQFVDSCVTNKKERRQVELLTKGQSNNLLWYHLRAGSLTTTKFNRVYKFMTGSKASLDKLLNDCMGDRYRFLKEPPKTNKKSLKWGLTQETPAKNAYFAIEKDKHSNLSIRETGLIVHPQKSYLRGSPDGIVTCDCCCPRLLEIKCPYSAANEKIHGNQKIGYLNDTDGKLSLRNTPMGYMDQIQGCMAVTSLNLCHFVVYTVVDIVTIPVEFDKLYWENQLQPQLDNFFRHHLAPMIFHRQRHPQMQFSTCGMDSSDTEEESQVFIFLGCILLRPVMT